MKLFTYVLSVAIAFGGIWQLTEASQDFWSNKKSESIGHSAAAAAAFALFSMTVSIANDIGDPSEELDADSDAESHKI